jgi:hypothetical protein
MATQATPKVTVSAEELAALIESVVRRVVREELAQLLAGQPVTLRLKEDSPLYEDMADILDRSQRGETGLHTHAEVWGE